MTVARERSRLVPLKAMLIDRPTSLITADAVRLVSTMPVIVSNRFIFFGILLTKFNFIKQISLNFS